MFQTKNKGLWILIVVTTSLSLVISACVGSASQPAQEVQVVYPTVLVTQIVQQIVATPTATSLPAPTEAVRVVAPAASTGWDPFAVPIYYPIRGCFASRLHVGDVAFVANGAGAMGIHQTQDIGYSPIWRHLDPGELMDVIDGPWCDRGALTWKVATADGYIGYVPEGDGNVYWLLPMSPVTDQVLSDEELELRMFLPPGETLRLMGPKANYCR